MEPFRNMHCGSKTVFAMLGYNAFMPRAPWQKRLKNAQMLRDFLDGMHNKLQKIEYTMRIQRFTIQLIVDKGVVIYDGLPTYLEEFSQLWKHVLENGSDDEKLLTSVISAPRFSELIAFCLYCKNMDDERVKNRFLCTSWSKCALDLLGQAEKVFVDNLTNIASRFVAIKSSKLSPIKESDSASSPSASTSSPDKSEDIDDDSVGPEEADFIGSLGDEKSILLLL